VSKAKQGELQTAGMELTIPATKVCKICGKEKSMEDFYTNSHTRDGRSSWCKECTGTKRRTYALIREYGITDEDYDNLLEFQEGVCAICGKSCATGRKLSVDHDHSTGKIRGLLCNYCNHKLLGPIRDNLSLLKKMVDYMEFNPSDEVFDVPRIAPRKPRRNRPKKAKV